MILNEEERIGQSASAGISELAAELAGVDRHLEDLLAVDRDDGHAQTVGALELQVVVDQDLLELERDLLADGEQHVAGLVAEVAGRARVQRDGGHGRGCYRPRWDTASEMESDLELTRRLADRDTDAFEELYRRYAPASYGVAIRVLRDPTIAQEVVQDAFAALWRAPEVYDAARGAFRSFFLSLVHHRAVDIVRKEERLRERERRVNRGRVEDEADVGEVVAEEADLADRRRAVRDALASLPPEQREALELMYFEGWTQARIAEETGVPLGTVKTRVLAAMRKLRGKLS